MPRKLLLAGVLLGTAALAVPAASPRPALAGKSAPVAKKKPGKAAAAPPAEAPPEEATPEAAQLHEDVGEEHFGAGRFDKALAEFQVADAIRSTPHRRMMMARCLEKVGRVPEALAIYKVIAARSPDPFDVDEARRRIKELTPKPSAAEMGADPFGDGETTATPAPAPPPPPVDETPPAKAPAKKSPARSSARPK